MKLSDDRINNLSHKILKALKAQGQAQYPDETKALHGIKQAIHDFGAILEGIDASVRKKIASMKRQILDGSREFELLYRQYFDEELGKKGL